MSSILRVRARFLQPTSLMSKHASRKTMPPDHRISGRSTLDGMRLLKLFRAPISNLKVSQKLWTGSTTFDSMQPRTEYHVIQLVKTPMHTSTRTT